MEQTKTRLAFFKGRLRNSGGSSYVLIPNQIREGCGIDVEAQADVEIYQTEERLVVEVSFPAIATPEASK